MHFWDSIRWRVFIYYTTLIAAMLALLIGLHAVSVKESMEQLDESKLRSHAVALLPIFFQPLPHTGGEDRPPGHREAPERTPPPMDHPMVRRLLGAADKEGWFYFALDGRGKLISASKGAPASLQAPELWRHVDQFQAMPIHGYLTVVAKTPVGERLVLGISYEQVQKDFLDYLLKALLVGVAIFVVASATGFWIISLGLKPIAQISDTAQRIAQGDLSGRIDVKSQRSELGQLARILNGTFDRLSGALQRQVQFTADASHELRTPISAIIADCQFSLKKERPTERYKETIEVCHESAQHMRLLIERLSLLARFDAHDSMLQKESVDLKEVGECAIAVVAPVAEEKGIRVEADLSSATVTADRLRLEQVAINLMTNAVRYNKPNGTVKIRSGRSGSKAFVEVKDSGIGIPKEMLDRVFDRFFRVDDSRNSGTGGTGLGLAICRSIVEAHGGTVNAESEVGRGSTFRIEFPAE
jgi:two-component system OmpR family sensor kinase